MKARYLTKTVFRIFNRVLPSSTPYFPFRGIFDQALTLQSTVQVICYYHVILLSIRCPWNDTYVYVFQVAKRTALVRLNLDDEDIEDGCAALLNPILNVRFQGMNEGARAHTYNKPHFIMKSDTEE